MLKDGEDCENSPGRGQQTVAYNQRAHTGQSRLRRDQRGRWGTALRCAKEQKPDLILLDLLLPKVSGLGGLTRLKHNRDTAKIPVVALSGLSDKNRQRLLDAGVDEYLEKNSVITDKGLNRLPKVLEDVICRINRKRGMNFSPVLNKKTQ